MWSRAENEVLDPVLCLGLPIRVVCMTDGESSCLKGILSSSHRMPQWLCSHFNPWPRPGELMPAHSAHRCAQHKQPWPEASGLQGAEGDCPASTWLPLKSFPAQGKRVVAVSARRACQQRLPDLPSCRLHLCPTPLLAHTCSSRPIGSAIPQPTPISSPCRKGNGRGERVSPGDEAHPSARLRSAGKIPQAWRVPPSLDLPS